MDEPLPIKAQRLLNSTAEVAAIASLFDEAQLLVREAATRKAVHETLPRAQVAHFSCHGRSEGAEPLKSGLLMANDQMFTVADLFRLHLAGSRLATLSACETSVIGTRLPDEVVSLPATFMQAGFAGVVASLWSVEEVSTAMLMERFYRVWRVEGLEPVLALRKAQRWLRDTTNREKAAYFSRHVPAMAGSDLLATAVPKMPDTAALDFISHVLSNEQGADAYAFAHPYFWAAFSLTGV